MTDKMPNPSKDLDLDAWINTVQFVLLSMGIACVPNRTRRCVHLASKIIIEHQPDTLLIYRLEDAHDFVLQAERLSHLLRHGIRYFNLDSHAENLWLQAAEAMECEYDA